MDFTFPEDKVLINGTIQNFYLNGQGRKIYESIDISNPKSNVISINKIEYFFTYLTNSGKNKGGNSIILKLYESQTFDTEEIKYGTPDLILKILKFKKGRWLDKSQNRFMLEINALINCRKSNCQNVISIYDNGTCKILDFYDEKYKEYLFYTMEYAQFDLRSYIESKHSKLSLNEKLNLCISIAKGLKELMSMGYFHRDIKPDNIFITDDVWKIGDLGLIGIRDDYYSIDDIAEPIGPRGWMSPESMNKYLTEDKGFSNTYDCKIDHQSDIFQLGKVFWYIFQHNAPIGTIKENDFKLQNSDIYSVIKTMLNHSKIKRYKTIDEVITLLEKIELKVLKTKRIKP